MEEPEERILEGDQHPALLGLEVGGRSVLGKVICLLQYVQSVHRSPENIAAALHGSVDADSRLASVKEALRALEAADKVRRGDDGYRIPTPAEDDWERSRNGINPSPGDAHRVSSEMLAGFWQPQPLHTLFDTKTFKAARRVEVHDVLQVTLEVPSKSFSRSPTL